MAHARRSRPEGYSNTPLPRKLGIGPGVRLRLVGAPAAFEATLGKLPEGARIVRGSRGSADLSMWFVRTRAELDSGIAAMSACASAGALWIVWPKKSSALASDFGEAEVRAAGLANQIVDYKVCAVDATWSALKFARRRVAAEAGKARGR